MDAVFVELLADVDKFAGPEASAAIAKLAAEKRDEVIGRDKPSAIATHVDGRETEDLKSVSPRGVIRFDFSYGQEILQAILAMLVAASPYAAKRDGASPSTHYRDEHAIFIDGAEVTELPKAIPAGAEIVLVNLQPYARRIEQGHSLQAPHGVYEVVARLAKRRFSNTAAITFGYREIPNAGPAGPASRRGGKAAKQDDMFPAITIKARLGADGAGGTIGGGNG